MRILPASLCLAVAATLGAAVEVQAEVGGSIARILEGDQVILAGIQPAVLWRNEALLTPVLGIQAGPMVMVDSDAGTWAAGIEVRLVAGLGWRPAGWPRLDLLGGWGGGLWRDAGLCVAGGWGHTLAAEAVATWALDDRLRVGPALGWSRHLVGSIEVEEWRAAVAVAYRFGG